MKEVDEKIGSLVEGAHIARKRIPFKKLYHLMERESKASLRFREISSKCDMEFEDIILECFGQDLGMKIIGHTGVEDSIRGNAANAELGSFNRFMEHLRDAIEDSSGIELGVRVSCHDCKYFEYSVDGDGEPCCECTRFDEEKDDEYFDCALNVCAAELVHHCLYFEVKI